MATIIKGIIKHRYDTVANYVSDNPVMLAGEMGIESTTGRVKYGDGTTAWNSLAYSGLKVQPIAIDTALMAVEGREYFVTNTDTSSHIITYGGNTTVIQPDYTSIFYYVNSAWVYLGSWNVSGDFIAGGNISAIGSIAGSLATPSIYDFYDQEPQTATPTTKFAGTSWENVSERSVFYHLAASSGGAETDVVIRDLVEHDDGAATWAIDKEYAFADLVYDDVIGGAGTHAGKYVIAVDNYSGMSRRYDGGLAETFEGGTQSNKIIEHTHNLSTSNGTAGTQYLTGTGAGGISRVQTAAFENNEGATAVPGGVSIEVGDENNVDNYTIKKWRRVS